MRILNSPAAVNSVNVVNNTMATVGFDGKAFSTGVSQKTCQANNLFYSFRGSKLKKPLMFQITGYRFFTWMPALFVALHVVAVVPDTTRIYPIGEVTVTANTQPHAALSTAPLNVISAEQMVNLNVLQVADVVKFFPGVTVRDYGGIGGLKTVSVRSLGASHTAVSYDGVILSDVQTGQIDIGRFSLENVETVAINNGQSDNIFQPARSFAAASLLGIRTKTPSFENGKRNNTYASVKSGSFGLLNPSFLYQHKLNEKAAVSVSGEWLNSHGQYPYLLDYSYSGDGIQTSETRKNTDVQHIRLEGSAHWNFSETDKASLKAYFYRAERGLPGATVLYNTDNFSSQRLWDQTFFTQAYFGRKFSQQWSVQFNAKYNAAKLHYLDSTYHNDSGIMESRYEQKEYYLAATALFRPAARWMFSFSSDGFINHMDASFESAELTDAFARPTRFNLLHVLAAKYVDDRFSATSSLLSTLVKDDVKTGNAGEKYNRLSPYLSFSWQPFKAEDFRLRAFYKHIFRLPAFNDLYYARSGNAGLKPETTFQWNGGVTWTARPGTVLPLFLVSADFFKNRVMDKIVAMPSKNIFVWSMTNLGVVDITGYDFSAEGTLHISGNVNCLLSGTYTWQKAVDVTDPDGRSYGHQLPYTPRISGSGRAALETSFVNVAYSLVWSGKRYAGFQNYAENRLPAYADHGLSAYRDFNFKNIKLHVKADVINLFNKQYAVVKWFPMPGRSFRFTAGIQL